MRCSYSITHLTWLSSGATSSWPRRNRWTGQVHDISHALREDPLSQKLIAGGHFLTQMLPDRDSPLTHSSVTPCPPRMAEARVVAHSRRSAISSMPAFINSRDNAELFAGGVVTDGHGGIANRSGVVKQRFETVIHVLLDMAMKQGETRLVGGEIHDRPTVVRNYHRILNNASSLLAVDLG